MGGSGRGYVWIIGYVCTVLNINKPIFITSLEIGWFLSVTRISATFVEHCTRIHSKEVNGGMRDGYVWIIEYVCTVLNINKPIFITSLEIGWFLSVTRISAIFGEHCTRTHSKEGNVDEGGICLGRWVHNIYYICTVLLY
jgi:hypothetical protein